MPRRLEIRTTILAKKSEARATEKDANANDVYADEAMQLLEELQQLKSNVRMMNRLNVELGSVGCFDHITRHLSMIPSNTNRWPYKTVLNSILKILFLFFRCKRQMKEYLVPTQNHHQNPGKRRNQIHLQEKFLMMSSTHPLMVSGDLRNLSSPFLERLYVYYISTGRFHKKKVPST